MSQYFIECEAKINGRRVTYFCERDCDQMLFQQTVDDIADGQVEGVRKVYRADLEAKTFTDASEDVAQAIIDRTSDGADMPVGAVFDFCEDALGVWKMAEIEREMEAA